MGGRLGPLAVAVQAAIGSDGAEHAVYRRCDVACILDDVSKRGAEIAFPGCVESGGMGVTIERAPADVEVTGGETRRVPVEKFLFDGIALGVIADGAAARVIIAGRELGGGRRSLLRPPSAASAARARLLFWAAWLGAGGFHGFFRGAQKRQEGFSFGSGS